jgi:hypothetical protein
VIDMIGFNRTLTVIVGFNLTILMAGCQAPQLMIPIGEWHGQGTLVYSAAPESDSNAPAELIRRQYQTSLLTSRRHVDGHPVVYMEILSKRGDLPDLEDQTHLKMILFDVDQDDAGDDSHRYRIVDQLFNPDPDEELSWKEPGDFPRQRS